MKSFKHKILISFGLMHIFLMFLFLLVFVFYKQLNINPITLVKISTVSIMSLLIFGAFFCTKNFSIIKKNEVEIKEKNILNSIFAVYMILTITIFIYLFV